MDDGTRQLHLRLSVEEYKKLKVKCAYGETTMQRYVVNLIRESLDNPNVREGNLLIVEDEAIVRESLRDSLNETHLVTTAETGEDALELIKKRDFDILIIDIRLPGKSGIDVIREVKTAKPFIKPIVITAFPSVELAVDAMKQGAVDYLVKPIRIEELEKLIGENLPKAHSERKSMVS